MYGQFKKRTMNKNCDLCEGSHKINENWAPKNLYESTVHVHVYAWLRCYSKMSPWKLVSVSQTYDWGKLCKRSQVPVFFRQQLSCRIPLLAIKCSLFSPPSKLHVLMLHMTIICFFLLCPYIFNTICNTKSVHHVNILYAFDARLTR